MESIIDKLNQLPENDTRSIRENWTLEEKKQLLELYFIISKKEKHIFDLIYLYHGCDSWEDIFRDYDKNYLKDKATGVKIAIDEIKDRMENLDGESKIET